MLLPFQQLIEGGCEFGVAVRDVHGEVHSVRLELEIIVELDGVILRVLVSPCLSPEPVPIYFQVTPSLAPVLSAKCLLLHAEDRYSQSVLE